MTSLQAVDPYPRSYYVATATGMLPAPPLQADRRADVCIVGGGFTGVATALHLAERGYQAVVVESTDRTLVFRFATGWMPPPYSSGAPVLNAAGEVVGLNAGGGVLSGVRMGHAHSVACLRRHLADGIGRSR